MSIALYAKASFLFPLKDFGIFFSSKVTKTAEEKKSEKKGKKDSMVISDKFAIILHIMVSSNCDT